jgi:hypothetical protein
MKYVVALLIALFVGAAHGEQRRAVSPDGKMAITIYTERPCPAYVRTRLKLRQDIDVYYVVINHEGRLYEFCWEYMDEKETVRLYLDMQYSDFPAQEFKSVI